MQTVVIGIFSFQYDTDAIKIALHKYGSEKVQLVPHYYDKLAGSKLEGTSSVLYIRFCHTVLQLSTERPWFGKMEQHLPAHGLLISGITTG